MLTSTVAAGSVGRSATVTNVASSSDGGVLSGVCGLSGGID